MIETGESEAIFQKAIMEQGRGHVRHSSSCSRASLSDVSLLACVCMALNSWMPVGPRHELAERLGVTLKSAPLTVCWPHVQVTDTLQEIQDRHDAVRQLEQSLMDVHQMFLDMAVLVESQGEMLNNIEAQVCSWLCLLASSSKSASC